MIYLFLILIILGNAGETIAYKNSKSTNSTAILYGVCLWSFILSIPVIVVAGVVNGISIFDNLNLQSFGYVVLISVLGGVNIITWVVASKNMPMSIAEGVSEIYIAFLTLFSWMFFGGSLSVWQVLLIGVTIVACIVLGFLQNRNGDSKYIKIFSEVNKKTIKIPLSEKSNLKNYNYKLGFIFLFIWVFISIIRGLLPGVVAQTGLNSFVYSFLMNIIMLAIAIVLMSVRKVNFKAATKMAFKDPWLLVVAICRTVSQLVILYLALHMNLGVVDAISVFGLVLIMLYERLIMKEKVKWFLYPIMLVIAVATAVLCVI